jgi:hypothetical protein
VCHSLAHAYTWHTTISLSLL